MYTIGTQLFGYKDEFEKDLYGTFKAIKELGYGLVEGLIIPQDEQGDRTKNFWALSTFKDVVKYTKELGLQMISIHVSFDYKTEKPATIAHYMQKVTELSEIRTFIFSGMFSTAEDARAYGLYLNEVLAEAESLGFGKEILMLVHNHGMEFTRIAPHEYVIDELLKAARPEIGMELDFGWADYADVPLEDLPKYFDRTYMIHLKDFYEQEKDGTPADTDVNSFAPIGMGVTPVPEDLKFLKDIPNLRPYVIIDQDYYPEGILKAAEIGIHYVKELLAE